MPSTRLAVLPTGPRTGARTGNCCISAVVVNFVSSDQAFARGGRDRIGWDLLFP